jgi:membrane protease YdiL (CAAX protease family)
MVLLLDLVAVVLLHSSFLNWIYGTDVSGAFEAGDQAAHVKFMAWLQLFYGPALVVFILGLFRLASRTRPSQLGLTLHRARHDAALGTLAWLLVTPQVMLLNFVVTIVYVLLTQAPKPEHSIVQLVKNSDLPVDWILMVVLAVGVAPLVEELIFRGVLQRWLSRRSWGGDTAMAGALLIALYQRAPTLQEAIERRDVSYVFHELGPALFVLALVPGYLWIDRVAGRLFPVPRIHAASALSLLPDNMAPPDKPRTNGPVDWYLARINHPPGPTSINIARAIYGTAGLFAMFHSGQWPDPIPLFLLALALGWLAYRTQKLSASVVLHALFNGVTIVIVILTYLTPDFVEENGKHTTSAIRRLPVPSISSFVPTSWWPRRT